MPPNRLFTIGHSNHDFARFLQLLNDAGISAVADVRSQPSSFRYPQYNRSELEKGLRDAGICYVFLGHQLGGRPPDLELYDEDGRVNYERVRRTSRFQQGLERVCQGLEEYAIALVCSEEEPLECHRVLLIAPALVERGLAPVHLRGDGTRETTAELEDRLLAETGVGVGLLDGLFAQTVSDDDRQALLAQAYRLQARRKAFRLRPDEPETTETEDN
jgi:uncharacterized protein (DUF488 family)